VSPAAWFFLAVLAFVALIILEGRRQARRYGEPSGRPNLAGVGLLELQRHLQADRKVEVIVEQVKKESGQVEEDASGDPPAP
jgi:hypothetical protein